MLSTKTSNYDDIVPCIRKSELDSLRLGRDFGNVKLYSDSIGSAPRKRS